MKITFDTTDVKSLENATCLDDVLCLATLIAKGELQPFDTVNDARLVWLKTYDGSCENCPHLHTCLACIINE